MAKTAALDPADFTETISVSDPEGARTEVQGLAVAPGLAITQSTRTDRARHRGPRYVLTHIPSGLAVGPPRCADHIQQITQAAVTTGIDWTTDRAAVVEAVKAAGVTNILGTPPSCRNHCTGDGPEPKSWGMRCTTCGYEWEDEYDEGPIDAKQAKELARDHECEPHVEILPPDSDQWLDPFRVNDDGTLPEPGGRDNHPMTDHDPARSAWFVDGIADAIARFCTKDGTTVDAVADSFCDINGYTPNLADVAAALGTLASVGRVRIAGDRYFWHATDQGAGGTDE